jgi:4-hydroxybenzoate polyprenyltransferase
MLFVGSAISALRPHHWVKNLLVFVPILAAHRWDEPALWAKAGIAVVAFSLCSSAVYLTNDMMDVGDDRAHPVKRHRPLASGRLQPGQMILMACLLAVSAFGLAAVAGAGTLAVIAVYAVGSLAYSAWLKTLKWIDLLALVVLYTLRLLAGGAATGIAVSGWLLMYGAFVFASLVLAKRTVELRGAAAGMLPLPQRRGYRLQDQRLLTSLGLTAAVGSGVLLMLYLQDGRAQAPYDRPGWLMLGGAAVVLWLMRVWRLVSQQRLHTDPIVFALKDPASLAAGAGVLLLFFLAAG